jgi:ribokinase
VDAFMTLPEKFGTLNSRNRELTFKHGAKIDVEKYTFSVGGNATNVSVGLSRLGLRAGLCTEMGDDELSLIIRNALANERVERLLIKQTSGSASSFSVILNFEGDRTIFVEDVERKHDFDFGDVTAPVVYLTSLGREWKEPYKRTVEFVKDNECTLAFNPGSRQLRQGKDVVHMVIKETEMLFVNKEEAELLLFDKETEQHSEDHIKSLLKDLQKLGPKTIVITDGQHGSFAISPIGEFYHEESGKRKSVERTGAGDAYTTGFLAASIYGLSLPDAMKWGTENASSVVAQIGAQAGLLNKTEMEEETTIHTAHKATGESVMEITG